MTPQRQQDIKVVASRVQRILKGTEGTPMQTMFWEDIAMLLKLILEEEKGE
jgi:hypothetical protein